MNSTNDKLKVGFFGYWYDLWDNEIEEDFNLESAKSRFTKTKDGVTASADVKFIANETEHDIFMRKYGGNIGNNCFRYGLRHLFDNDVIYIDNGNRNISGGNGLSKFKPDDIDVLVIPAANWVGGQWNGTHVEEVINYFNKPVLVVGLGAQSFDGTLVEEPVKGATKSFLDTIWSKQSHVLVRGKNTYNIIKNMGYDTNKMTVFGCPSMFLNPDKLLAEKVSKKINLLKTQKKKNIACYPSYFSDRELSDKHQLSSLVETEDIIIAQSSFLIPLVGKYKNSGKLDFSEKDFKFKEFINDKNIKKIIYIEDIYEQAKFLNENIDFTYGTRIHGSVLTLMSEVPTLLVYWDDRTRELGEELCIPSIPQSRFKEILEQKKIDNLIDFVKFDVDAFNTNRKNKATILNNKFKEFGIAPSKKLLSFLE